MKTVKNIKDRISMTKFRLSNHTLMIEKGRHLNLDKADRKCQFCLSFDNEAHFLLSCRTYSALRCDLLMKVEKILKDERLRRADSKMMLKYLLGNTENSTNCGKIPEENHGTKRIPH